MLIIELHHSSESTQRRRAGRTTAHDRGSVVPLLRGRSTKEFWLHHAHHRSSGRTAQQRATTVDELVITLLIIQVPFAASPS